MTLTHTATIPVNDAELQQKAKDHLWMAFARQSVMEDGPGVPIIVKGEGHRSDPGRMCAGGDLTTRPAT